ncbi:biotin synthase BioB [Desulfosporosinus sp. PR]|uniref:biotin synthase BioB n=1 Tax=Candidatus Desulfosporosinus nitrosoreducens TaxID=3401928 RepID=UPI0027F922D6|nr:biotin synthase BioB [Desulfosporosinus sp. PR]MDQ7095730.1 biotin synthase BioB [Desulfosporosinus sp. PR]
MIEAFKNKVLSGGYLTRENALSLQDAELEALCQAANALRIHFCGNGFDICTIINGKSGRCTEDCHYCAQSAHYPAEIEEYPLLDRASLLKQAVYNYEKSILRYSVVTSGRRLSDAEVEEMCAHYLSIRQNCPISLCASHGLLTYEHFVKLKAAGVTRYHNNLETSRRFFSSVCTTHTFEEKIATIQAAQRAGLVVCSGGIMGLGERMEDRIDMALELRALGIKSIPLNILNPIKGTPCEKRPPLKKNEVRRSVAIYRFLLPDAALRLAGGRGLLPDKGRSLFCSGANAAISGDMLTTSGISINEDMRMLSELGFEVRKL